MDPNLIIDDDYVKRIGISCNQRGKKLEEILDSYLTILNEIEGEALVEGEITKSLNAYKECVALLNDQLVTLSANIQNICKCFLTDINDADDYLF